MSKAAELAALIGSGQAQGDRNLIINGAMQVAQRGTSGTTNTGYNSVDRFATQAIATDNLAMTLTQQTDSPAGFSNSLKLTVTTAESALASDEFFSVQHRIEAQNLQRLQYGASAAKSVTLSFYVKGTTTGTYTVALQQIDGARVITSTYAISSANTWEKKTLTFTGDPSGSFANDNGEGLRIHWFLAAGSDYTSVNSTAWSAYADNKVAFGHAVNIIDSTSKTWQLAGVQLEIGDVATPFEHEDIGTTLAKCQRYTYIMSSSTSSATTDFINGAAYSASQVNSGIDLPVTMRATPTVTYGNGTGAYRFYRAGGYDAFDTLLSDNPTNLHLQFAGTSGLSHTSGVAGCIQLRYGDGAFITADAEL
jgi:hypothetical protein